MDISRVRVLIVDDCADWLAGLTTFLSVEGVKVIDRASSGLQALRKARELQPTLILMDMNLPDMTGIEVSRQILTLAPASKILFLSSDDHPKIVERALAAGGYGYVVKSRASSELLGAIHLALRNKAC
jgi:DNA-binding NarL/FixJ family response regulator